MTAARGLVIGVLSAGVTLGVAHLVAALVDPAADPVLAVGSVAVDLAPQPVKAFAIRTFGTNDKIALLVGVYTLLALSAVLLGAATLRRRRYGLGGLAAFAAVGVAAALSRPTATLVDVLPVLAGAGIGQQRCWWWRAPLGRSRFLARIGRGCSTAASFWPRRREQRSPPAPRQPSARLSVAAAPQAPVPEPPFGIPPSRRDLRRRYPAASRLASTGSRRFSPPTGTSTASTPASPCPLVDVGRWSLRDRRRWSTGARAHLRRPARRDR